MSRKLVGALLVSLLALRKAVTAVVAIVTFDLETGTGFVGKGDVQLAFGGNNATLQKNAQELKFSCNYLQIAYLDCQATFGPITVERTLQKFQLVHDVVQSDARVHKQVDGFVLEGYGAITTIGTTPSYPDFATPVGGHYYSEPIFPQLEVNHNGMFAKIWEPAP